MKLTNSEKLLAQNLLPLIQGVAEGRTLQFGPMTDKGQTWKSMSLECFLDSARYGDFLITEWRLKPEPRVKTGVIVNKGTHLPYVKMDIIHTPSITPDMPDGTRVKIIEVLPNE